MRNVLLFTSAMLLTLISGAHSESEMSATLRKLQRRYEKAAQSGGKPDAYRYGKYLQQFLMRAQNAGDKQAALETLTELRKIGPAAIQYIAKIKFEFSALNENAEKFLRENMVGDPFISSLTRIRNTEIYELTVTAADAEFAAARANDLIHAMKVSAEFANPYRSLNILEPAEPPAQPIEPTPSVPDR